MADYLEFFADRPRDRRGPRVPRRRARRPRALRRAATRRERATARAACAADPRRGSTGRRVAHRRARHRRADLLRHVPAGRRQPRVHGGGGLRSGGDVRDAAAPTRAERRGAHHRGRLGRAHRRRARRAPSCRCCRCPTTSSPRSTPCSRRGGAGATRSTSPPPRRATPSRRSSSSSPRTTRVDAVLFLGSGVQSNQAKLMRTGDFATGHDLERIIEFHERQDARYAQVAADVSAASGQADPRRHGAGGDRSRQSRAAHGARDRQGLLLVRQSRRHRAGAPLAPGAVPRTALPAMSVWQRVVATILVIGAVVAVALAFTDDNAASGTTTAAPRWARRCGRRAASRNRSSTRSARNASSARSTTNSAARARASSSTAAARSWPSTIPTPRSSARPRRRCWSPRPTLSTLGPDFRYETQAVAPARTRQRRRRSAVPGGWRRSRAGHRRVPRLPADPTPHQGRRHDQPRHARAEHLRRGRAAHPRRDRRRRLPLRRPSATCRRGRTRTTPTATSVRSARSPSTTASARGRRARSWSTIPAQYAASELARLLTARGVQVGAVTRGVAPADGAPIAKVSSEPLNVGHRVDAQLQRQPQRRDVHQGARRAGVAAGHDRGGNRRDRRQADRAGRGRTTGSGSPTGPGSTGATR